MALLTKRTEASYGIAALRGILVDSAGGLLTMQQPRPSRRIEFVGASWFAGYGNEGASIQCSDLRSAENNYESVGPMTARLLGAEGVVVAYSGRGVVRNYGDPSLRSAEPFPVLYPRTLASRTEPLWDFGSFTAIGGLAATGTTSTSLLVLARIPLMLALVVLTLVAGKRLLTTPPETA